MDVSRLVLKNNFLSFFSALAASVVVFHYEGILEIQDECPMVLCYSEESGTGIAIFLCSC